MHVAAVVTYHPQFTQSAWKTWLMATTMLFIDVCKIKLCWINSYPCESSNLHLFAIWLKWLHKESETALITKQNNCEPAVLQVYYNQTASTSERILLLHSALPKGNGASQRCEIIRMNCGCLTHSDLLKLRFDKHLKLHIFGNILLTQGSKIYKSFVCWPGRAQLERGRSGGGERRVWPQL